MTCRHTNFLVDKSYSIYTNYISLMTTHIDMSWHLELNDMSTHKIPCHQELYISYNKTNSKMPSVKWRPFCLGLNEIVIPYGDIYLGRHWFRQWLAAWGQQTITWTNVDFSLVRFCGDVWFQSECRMYYMYSLLCVWKSHYCLNSQGPMS